MINQNSKFSDYSVESSFNTDDFFFKIDARLNRIDFSKKEMNYSLSYEGKFNASLGYHETKAEAYEIISSDTQALNFVIENKLNNNNHYYIYLQYSYIKLENLWKQIMMPLW